MICFVTDDSRSHIKAGLLFIVPANRETEGVRSECEATVPVVSITLQCRFFAKHVQGHLFRMGDAFEAFFGTHANVQVLQNEAEPDGFGTNSFDGRSNGQVVLVDW